MTNLFIYLKSSSNIYRFLQFVFTFSFLIFICFNAIHIDHIWHTRYNKLDYGSNSIAAQNSAYPGALGNGITSLIFSIPVAIITSLSKPNPNPACGTDPYLLRSRYHQ